MRYKITYAASNSVDNSETKFGVMKAYFTVTETQCGAEQTETMGDNYLCSVTLRRSSEGGRTIPKSNIRLIRSATWLVCCRCVLLLLPFRFCFQ